VLASWSTAVVIRRPVSAPSGLPSAVSPLAHAELCSSALSPQRFSIKAAARGKRLAAIIAWLGKLRVKVAADGTDINR
jgi:hypothetical protein